MIINPTTIVRDAIKVTKKLEPKYWQKCLSQRAGADEGHVGSYFPRLSAEGVEALICDLQWEPYTHSDVLPPAQAFIARSVPGIFGMVPFDDLPEDAELEFISSKEPDMVEVVWKNHEMKGLRVDFAVLLVGPVAAVDGIRSADIVYTFHPGDPVVPTPLRRHLFGVDRHLKKVTKKQCSEFHAGEQPFRWVKLG